MIYKFDWLNNGLEITDPIIEDNILLTNYNLDTKDGGVIVTLTTDSMKFAVELTNVNIPTVNKATVRTKTLDKLKEYEV